MSEFSFKRSLHFAFLEVKRWIFSPRMILIPAMAVFIYQYAVSPLLANADDMNSQLNLFEPFIAVANSGIILLILPVVFITLISDFPKINSYTLFYIVRIGRSTWLTGQILKLVMMVLSYLGAVFLRIFIRGHCGAFAAVRKYSLGMRQRLGLAQAIMENPEILILDEPMNGLDKDGVADMREYLKSFREQGKTILIASHSAEDISVLCDTVCEMDKGVLEKVPLA